MHAFRLTAPGELSPVATADPDPATLGPGEVLVRMHALGICGSDLPAYRGRRSLSASDDHFDRGVGVPGYPAHEMVGEVLATDSARLGAGDVVVGWIPSMRGLSEQVVTRAEGIITVDGGMPAAHAVVMQPLACVLHTLDSIGDVAGASVAVIGLGPIGLLFAHAAAVRGAREVVGVDPVDRSDIAEVLGIRSVRLAADQWAAGLSDGDRPEIVIEAVGHQVGTLHDAIDAAGTGARIFYFGVPDDLYYPVPINSLLRKNLTLQSGWVLPPDRVAALEASRDYARRYPQVIEALVTDVLPFRAAAEAFARAAHPRPGQHKVVLDYLTPA